MENIVFEQLNNGDIEECRNLCNELMAFQKSKAIYTPEAFDLMNFDTRMKPSYENSLDAQVIVAKCNGEAIGYIFSTIESTEGNKTVTLPPWVTEEEARDWLGFYPKWDNLPKKCGCLNNLYLRKEYRGLGFGSKLFNMSMEWLKNYPGIDLIFVYISNGNNEAMDFYLNHGFTYSHEVFGGFIKAAYYKI